MEPILDLELKGGAMWSGVLGRGKMLRLTDLKGDANVSALFYNADERTERYNMPDTLKGQHIFFLRAPYCLHSDMGRLLCSITRDTAGWHDTVCGTTTADIVMNRYGVKTYQEARNDFHRSGRANLLIEVAKWGLGKADLVPNVNFFSKVVADDAGRLNHVPRHSPAGSVVELRVEMRVLVVLTTCQHPLDLNPVYAPKPVRLEIFPGPVPSTDDDSFKVRPENLRAFTNTDTYLRLQA